MRRPSTITFLLLTMCSAVRGADYVVDLECIVFDSALPDQQMREFYEASKDRPAAEKNSIVTNQQLNALRAQSKLLHECKFTLLLSSNGIASQTQESSNFLSTVRLRLAEEKEDTCHIEIKWGAKIMLTDRQSLGLKSFQPCELTLGNRISLASSATNGGFMIFVAGIREAGPKDHEIELPQDFGKAFHEKRVKLQRRGDLTKN